MRPQLPRPLIAVVDDDVPVGMSLTRLLQQLGFYVQFYRTGSELLFSLGNRVPNCLLIDAQMPGQDGLLIIECIQRMNLALPIILATGNHDEDLWQRARQMGARGVLHKPYCVDDLCIKINQMLGCPGFVPTRCPWPCPAIGKKVWNCGFAGFSPEDRHRLNTSPELQNLWGLEQPARSREARAGELC